MAQNIYVWWGIGSWLKLFLYKIANRRPNNQADLFPHPYRLTSRQKSKETEDKGKYFPRPIY
jgi:hypothetical protein